tara:strand:+ start:168 stop:1391 length:1224 start_codon:yes stop_codon:yes gene_type:complete
MLIVYSPFCSPGSLPYSVEHLRSVTKGEVLDLNLVFHRRHFLNFETLLKESSQVYSENNRKVLNDESPELFDELLKEILDKKPDCVAFSFVYSSQVFYGYALLKRLKELGVRTVIGGPAVNDQLRSVSVEMSFEDFVAEFGCGANKMDFSDYNGYFVPENVVPVKTTSACYYRRCAFCTHFKDEYHEFSLDERSLLGVKKVFVIDDMVKKERLVEISKVFCRLGIEWMCQLKPSIEWDLETLKLLKRNGLKVVIWGVESGNDRVLKLMRKGTNVNDVRKVLESSKKVGIKNVVYVMFGFPTETRDEFLDTVKFLQENEMNIDLVSSSVFGLQKGSYVFENPEMFGIVDVVEKKRTLLSPSFSYTVSSGLQQNEIKELKKKYKKSIANVNKVPKWMNLYREWMLFTSC